MLGKRNHGNSYGCLFFFFFFFYCSRAKQKLEKWKEFSRRNRASAEETKQSGPKEKETKGTQREMKGPKDNDVYT